ncbi:hypothetical protein D3C72_177200 [compost metagenome]
MTDIMNAYQGLMLKAAQDEAFRDALHQAPKATLEAYLGTRFPEGFTINIVENSATELTLVLPPKLSDELSDEALASVAGGGSKGDDVLFSFLTLGVGCIASATRDSVGGCRQRWDEAESKRPFIRP